MKIAAHVIAISFFAAFCTLIHAESAYPTKAIKLIVQFPPGGTTDIVARMMADGMSKRLGQPIVVDNKTGAAGVIGTEAIAKATADGYTIGMATVTTNAINPFVRKLSFNTQKDITPVINVAAVTNVLAVNSSIPARNAAELVALLKANPEKYAYATPGAGSEGHVMLESFKKITGASALHIPYRGSAPAAQDTIAGMTQIMGGNLPPLLPFIQAGNLRALAVTGKVRLSSLPNIPTFTEAGYPDLNRPSWFGLVVPSKTPTEIVEKLNAAANATLATPEAKAALEKVGATVIGGTSAAFAATIKDEMAVQQAVVKFANISAD